jgi:hypothetical protein
MLRLSWVIGVHDVRAIRSRPNLMPNLGECFGAFSFPGLIQVPRSTNCQSLAYPQSKMMDVVRGFVHQCSRRLFPQRRLNDITTVEVSGKPIGFGNISGQRGSPMICRYQSHWSCTRALYSLFREEDDPEQIAIPYQTPRKQSRVFLPALRNV